jgi:hypothetical protein
LCFFRDASIAGRHSGAAQANSAEATRALLVDFMAKFDTGADGHLSADAIVDQIHAEDSVRCEIFFMPLDFFASLLRFFASC